MLVNSVPLSETIVFGMPRSAITVRRQGFWNQRRLKLRESLAHLVGLIMRRVVCDASVAFRVSFV